MVEILFACADCESEGHPYSTLFVNFPNKPCLVTTECDGSIRPLPPLPQTSKTLAPYARGLSSPFNGPMATSPAMELWLQDANIPEFPREKLHLLEKLGEGQFGEVHHFLLSCCE